MTAAGRQVRRASDQSHQIKGTAITQREMTTTQRHVLLYTGWEGNPSSNSEIQQRWGQFWEHFLWHHTGLCISASHTITLFTLFLMKCLLSQEKSQIRETILRSRAEPNTSEQQEWHKKCTWTCGQFWNCAIIIVMRNETNSYWEKKDGQFWSLHKRTWSDPS